MSKIAISAARLCKLTSPLRAGQVRGFSWSVASCQASGRKNPPSGDGADNMKTRSTSTGSTGSVVKHEKRANRFTMDLGDDKSARIDYRKVGPNTIDLYHTEVPLDLRGRGIGKALASGAFEAASLAKLKLRLSCSYLVDYADKHAEPKHKKLIERR